MAERPESKAEKISKAHLTELGESPVDERGSRWMDRQIGLIRDVKVRVSARLGGCAITVAKLFELKEGETLMLEQDLDAPIEILLEGNLIARGEIVVVGENYGVRITEVVEAGRL